MSVVSLPASFLSIPVPFNREQATAAPPMLTPRYDCVAQVQGEWFLAAVQSRYEKAVAWELHDLGADYYLPLSKRTDKSRHVHHVPLFEGYAFICGDAALKYCHEHRRVFDIGPIALQRQFVKELTSIEIALYVNPSLEVVEIKEPGQKVRVTWGAFQGFEGEVVKIADMDKKTGMVKVTATISYMNRAIEVEIDRTLLEVVQELPK